MDEIAKLEDDGYVSRNMGGYIYHLSKDVHIFFNAVEINGDTCRLWMFDYIVAFIPVDAGDRIIEWIESQEG